MQRSLVKTLVRVPRRDVGGARQLGAAEFVVVAGEIARLIGLLDDDSTEIAEDAKAELISIGSEVVQPLAAAAGSALIALLGSEHETVREWSAWVIAKLGVRDAVPMLLAAYRRQRASGNGPDWTEAVAFRHALTVLGSRQEVLPPLTLSLRTKAGSMRRTWPTTQLSDVITDLADHDQVRQVVEDARESALIEAAFVVARPNLFATVEWIDRADV